jgi:microcystin-dependent protein
MDSFLAGVILFGGNFAPRGWYSCQGQFLPISQNEALFSLLGTMYGGDGRTTFGIPDLRGRVPLGAGQGSGLTEYRPGFRRGQENVVLTTRHLAAHNHSATFIGTGGASGAALDVEVNIPVSTQLSKSEKPTANCYLAETAPATGFGQSDKLYRSSTDGIGANPVNLGGVTTTVTGGSGGITGGTVKVENRGGNTPVSLIQPSLAMSYILCAKGSFPARS